MSDEFCSKELEILLTPFINSSLYEKFFTGLTSARFSKHHSIRTDASNGSNRDSISNDTLLIASAWIV